MRRNLIFALLTLALAGCSSFWNWSDGNRSGTSSSLVDYLYPDGQVPPAFDETVPRLELPLRAGIAFVPGQSSYGTISEATKMQLLEKVKTQFVDREYISQIEVIPDTYLRSSKGITGMQQVARLYGVDVMALVSYDQVAVSEENEAGILYWTIVGAYVIKATSNEVQTFVDTAVFDVDTARLLFRAPGADTSGFGTMPCDSTFMFMEKRASRSHSLNSDSIIRSGSTERLFGSMTMRISSALSSRISPTSGTLRASISPAITSISLLFCTW